MNLADDGRVIINGALGITNTPKDANFTVGFILIMLMLFIVLNLIKSGRGAPSCLFGITALRRNL